jgi:aldehyde dehydrogenase (NAD+)
MGPVISDRQRERLEGHIRSGVEAGAALAFGGGRPQSLDRGFYVEPTLFVDGDNSMDIARCEIFGPVGVVIEFGDEDEAIRIANDSDYGLGGGVWSGNTARAYQVAKRLRTGTVLINGGGGGGMGSYSPFGGYKQSGLDVERGPWGLQEFLQVKHVGWSIR